MTRIKWAYMFIGIRAMTYKIVKYYKFNVKSFDLKVDMFADKYRITKIRTMTHICHISNCVFIYWPFI